MKRTLLVLALSAAALVGSATAASAGLVVIYENDQGQVYAVCAYPGVTPPGRTCVVT